MVYRLKKQREKRCRVKDLEQRTLQKVQKFNLRQDRYDKQKKNNKKTKKTKRKPRDRRKSICFDRKNKEKERSRKIL